MKSLFFGFLLLCGSIMAQESDLGAWYMAFGSKKIKENFNWHHEIQFRNYDFGSDLEQLLIRTGIGMNLSEGNNNLLLGYGYILSDNYVNDSTKNSSVEHRIFQQYITNQSFGRFALSHRYRIEQRFLENNNFRMRYRYFLSLRVALNKKSFEEKTFYLSAYNEIFINGDGALFDRDRMYGALGYMPKKNLRVELGYMSQVFEGWSRDQAQLAIFLNY
ncbi:MAG: DUF2490 domain-containing protein [Flavobacteriales bacterium]|nr:DUF2490 domain-containing protein [Flavobacteriales bacterium]